MATNNQTIMEAVWLSGTNDFQQRIPDPTQASLAQVSEALFDPMNNDLYNAWSNGLINRIGMTIFENKRFTNPLGIFRKPNMLYGKTIQQIAVKWAKAHSYVDDSETLLRYERPEFAAAFHTVDRFDKYKVSITRNELAQAMTEEYGINQAIDLAMASIQNPEAYDEMQIMLNCIALHEHNHGMYKHHISAMPTDKATAQELLAAVKGYVNQLQFPSSTFNAQDVEGIPTFARENECVILVTPTTMANLDVFAFAELFNVDRAEVRSRIVMVPEFPMPDVAAILTTEDFFMAARTEFGIYPFFDPNTLTTHQILHAQGVYSINPFCPAIVFTTGTATTPATVTQSVTGVEVAFVADTVEPGGTVATSVQLQGTIGGDGTFEVAPDSVTWALSCESEGEAVQLNSKTYMDRFGTLHVQKSGLATGAVITATGTATYVNPSGVTTTYTDSDTVTIA